MSKGGRGGRARAGSSSPLPGSAPSSPVGAPRADRAQPAHARFAERLAALGLDSALVGAAVACVRAALGHAGTYVPLEATLALAVSGYATAGVAWRGTTLGKALCGLAVRTESGAAPGFVRALARETICKLLSALPLLAGFLWAAASREGRAWHDALARTRVVRVPGRRAAPLAVPVALLSLGLFAAREVWRVAGLLLEVRPVLSAEPLDDRLTLAPVEASSVGSEQVERLTAWLDGHALDPFDYAVAKSTAHPVVIFGERHWRSEPLRFLRELLPRLHAEAGVTCLALEACLAADDPALERLVTGAEYDRELALRIARSHPSRSWGWREYWDVLEAVWLLNRTLPPDAPRMRVVGLDLALDLPSLALSGLGDDALDGPLHERLRVLRVLRELPRLLLRDAHMARRVEREILERGERGVVWVGAAHSSIHCPSPGPPGPSWGRMGYMLRRRHGEAVFQIRLHDDDLSVTASAPGYRGPAPVLAALIERSLDGSVHAAAGFDVRGSPFEPLRDSGCWDYHFDPGLSLGAVAAGYLYLAPARALTRCEWLPGYVTPRMFAAEAPYYRALAREDGASVRSAEELEAWRSR